MHFPLSAGLRTRHFWPMLLPLLLLLLPPLTLLGPSPANADLLQPDDEESSHQQQPRSGNRSLLHSSLDRVPVAHPTLLTILVTFLSCVLFFMICSMLLPLVTGGSGGGGGGCRQLWRRLRKRSSDSEKFESSVAPTVAPMKQSTLTLQPAPRLAPTAPCSSGATFTAIQCPVPIRIIEAASDDSDRESCVLVEDSDNDRDGGGGGGGGGSGGSTVAVRDNRMSSSTMRQSCGQPGPKQHCASTSSAAAPSSTLLCGSAFCYRSDPNIPGSRQQQQQQQLQLLQQRQQEKSAGTGEQEDSLLLL